VLAYISGTLIFYVKNGMLNKNTITIGTKIEVNNVSIKANNTPPFNCAPPPYVRLSDSLENASLIDALSPYLKEGESGLNLEEDCGVASIDAAI
jgi:hypothetical protein